MNPEQEINEAIDLAEQGQTEQAIKMLQTIQHPRDAYANAQFNLGVIFYQQDKPEEAEQAWKNIQYKDSSEAYAKAQLNLGILFDKQGKPEEAKKAWENIQEAKKAWENIQQKDFPKTYAKAQLNLGILFDKQGKPEEAKKAWENIQQKDFPKTYAEAQFNLGILFDKQGKPEEAEQAWKNIQYEDSSEAYAKAQLNLGSIFDEQGKPEEAKQAYKNVQRKDSPEAYANAQLNLGVLFYQQDKLEEAEQAWKNIQYEDSSEAYAKAQLNLGILFYQQDKLEDAEQVWKNIKHEDSDEIYTRAQFNLLTTGTLIIEQVTKYFKNIDKKHLPSEYNFTYAAIKHALDKHALEPNNQLLLDIIQSIHHILQDLALGQDEDECQFAHYTRPSTAHLLLSGKSPFRLNTIANVNDPTEGEILNHYLNYTLPENSKQAVFISCFTFNHDSLNQFRLYGKEDGQEASGCSIVLDKGFFHSNTMAIGAAMGASTYLMNNPKDEDIKSKEKEPNKTQNNTKGAEQDKPQDKVEKVIGLLPLYRCIYIDKQNPQYVRLACRDEVTFYREFPKETNEEIAEKWKEYQNIIQTKQKKVMQELDNIKKSIDKLNASQNQGSKLTEALNYILLPLRYLVKHAAFQEEQECRMFYITDWGDEHIQTDFNNHWLYVNYSEKPLKHLRKIYLSPGAIQHQHFFDILVFNENKKKSSQATDTHAKVCHSSNPFRNG